MHTPFTRHTTRGFTLVEAVISVLIVSMVSLGLIGSVIVTRHVAEYDKQRIAAIAAARQYAEDVRQRLSIDGITATTELENFNTPDELDDLQAELTVQKFAVNADGSRGAEITGTYDDNTQRVEVVITVTWNRTGSRSAKQVSEELHMYWLRDEII